MEMKMSKSVISNKKKLAMGKSAKVEGKPAFKSGGLVAKKMPGGKKMNMGKGKC